MNKKYTIVSDFKSLVQNKDKNFIEVLKSQNKAKEWKNGLVNVEIKDGLLFHNSDKVKEIVDNAKETLEAILKDEMDIDVVTVLKDDLTVIISGYDGNRKNQFDPFNKLNKDFIASGKVMESMKESTIKKINELLVKVHQKAYIEIYKVLTDLSSNVKDEHNISINLDSFESFANEKKKNAGMKLNLKGNLGKPNIDMITIEFNLVAFPLIEAKKLADIKDKEQQLLSKELSKIKTVGANEDLENSIKELQMMDIDINTYFVNIKDTAKSQITNVMQMVQNAIALNKKNLESGIKRDSELKIIEAIKDIDFSQAIPTIEFSIDSSIKLVSEFYHSDLKIEANTLLFDTTKKLVKMKEDLLIDESQHKLDYEIKHHKDEVVTSALIDAVNNVPCGIIQDEYKIVTIQALLKFKVKKTVSEKLIINKIWNMLNKSGLKESLESVEVV